MAKQEKINLECVEMKKKKFSMGRTKKMLENLLIL